MTGQGVEARHRKTCPGARDDGRCCKPTYRASVFDARTDTRIRSKPFATKIAAKQWRQDALVALRSGAITAAVPESKTVAITLDVLLIGMREGIVLDRSGRRYRPATIRSYSQAA